MGPEWSCWPRSDATLGSTGCRPASLQRSITQRASAHRAPSTGERDPPLSTSPRLEPFKTVIDDMLRADMDAPQKQRHTARRVLTCLVDEHDAVDLSYSTVRDLRRQAPCAEPSTATVGEAFVPQTHLPDDKVDSADSWLCCAGQDEGLPVASHFRLSTCRAAGPGAVGP